MEHSLTWKCRIYTFALHSHYYYSKSVQQYHTTLKNQYLTPGYVRKINCKIIRHVRYVGVFVKTLLNMHIY